MAKISNNVLVKSLIEFGLGEKEAHVYLALLQLEIASATEVADTANVNRSSTYVVLEGLKEKGLVAVSEENNIQKYVAVSPDMLLFEAQNKAQKAQDIKNNIGDIVPELKALHKDTKQKPKIKVFEGKQGLISAFEDTLNNTEKVMRVASSVENLFNALPEYFPQYVQKRAKLGIKTYGIHPYDKATQELIKAGPKFDKPILIPPEKYKFPADVAIYDNKISYMSLGKGGVCITIESKEISDVMKNIFDLAYKEAQRLHKIGHLVTRYKSSITGYSKKE